MKKYLLFFLLAVPLLITGGCLKNRTGKGGDATGQAPRKVTVAAIRITWGKGVEEPPEQTIGRGLDMAEEAARMGARYIVLPENFLHADRKADQTIPGPLTDKVVEIARQHNVYILTGMVESERSRSRTRPDDWDDYLSAVLIGPGGIIGVHRKVDIVINPIAPNWRREHPKTDMDVWGGDDFKMYQAGEIERIAIMICRDARTNWAWTRVLSQDPKILFSPNLRSSITKYGADFPAMAKKYGLPIVAADGHPESESMIIDRDGNILDMETAIDRVLIGEVILADDHPGYTTFEVVHNDNNPG
jgi:predicted amidohydrolase